MSKVVFDKTITLSDDFVGTERLASAIGNGGLADVGHPIVDGDVLADKRRERDTVLFRVMEPYPLRINRNRLDTLYSLTRPDTTAELTYFFHPDHLGSASWITDLSGQLVHLFFRISKFGSLEYQHLQCEKKPCAIQRKTLFLPAKRKVAAMKATANKGDCKSPYSALADCKSAGTGRHRR